MKPENLTIQGVFTGTVGILPWESTGTSGGSNGKVATTPTVNAAVGNLDNANIEGATIRIDGYTTYGVKLNDDGTQLLVSGPTVAQTTAGQDSFTYDTLQEAIDKYPSNNAIITMLSNWDASTVVDKDSYLNLNGFTIADLSVNAGNTVYVYDTATDDYTVEDAIGSGSITAIKGDGAVVGLPADSPLSRDPYIKVTDSDGTTFHRLNLEICSVSLRPVEEPSIYYTCNFGGDEVIKSMVQSYGVALGAGKKPDFSAKSYTSKPGTEWKVGLDANGNPNNRSNGTLLSGVMRPSNTYTINRRNSSVQIYSQGYIILNDEENTKICGNIKNMSMADIFQGVQDKVSGIDSKWSTLDTSVQSSIKTMYQTFGTVMDRWNIPNILTGINSMEASDTSL